MKIVGCVSADGSGDPVVLTGHEDSVLSASWSPDGTQIVTASSDGTARIWSADCSSAPRVLAGHGGLIRSASWSPDGTRIVTASNDRTARVWSADGSSAPVVLNGYRLPAGINVSPAIYLLHRRPDVYPEPTVFRPERFLEEPPDTYQWIPFGGGTRRCIGASFAMTELRIVLSTILQETRLSLVDARPERIRARAVVFVPARGVRVRLEALGC